MENNEKRYVWVRWGDEWEIAINVYDEDECKFIWVLNGMHITKEPDEIGGVVTRESQKPETSDEALPIDDVGGSYRMLRDGEVIKDGDEFRDANFNWKKSNSCGEVFTHEDYYPHRRLE